MSATARKAPARNERGWTLIELMITMVLLVIVLLAVLSIADATQKQANADNERSLTINSTQVSLQRMSQELRQACALFVPAATPTTGTYCFNQFSTAPGATLCTRTSDCIDFVMRKRTVFTRSGASVSSISHPLQRVRYNCAVADPSSTSDLVRTECVRYAADCSATSCPSPTTQTDVVARAVLNSGSSGSPNNVFQYCTRADPYTCSVTPTTTICSDITTCTSTVAAVKISWRIARRGTLARGNDDTTSFLLQDGVELKSLDSDSSNTT